jgi:hypothetical protein
MTLTSYLCLVTKTSKSTQIYTLGCDPDLAAGPCATHPAALLEHGEIASSKAVDAEC